MSFSNANLTAPVDPGIENIDLLLTVLLQHKNNNARVPTSST